MSKTVNAHHFMAQFLLALFAASIVVFFKSSLRALTHRNRHKDACLLHCKTQSNPHTIRDGRCLFFVLQFGHHEIVIKMLVCFIARHKATHTQSVMAVVFSLFYNSGITFCVSSPRSLMFFLASILDSGHMLPLGNSLEICIIAMLADHHVLIV